jgi:NhaP-type Na+/H+ or K+/H+ antiporter
MTKLMALFALFRKGNAVANPELWKHGGAALQAALVSLIVSLASTGTAFGIDLDMSTETAGAVAAGIMALSSVVVTYITSKRIGLPAAPSPQALPTPAQNDLRGGP